MSLPLSKIRHVEALRPIGRCLDCTCRAAAALALLAMCAADTLDAAPPDDRARPNAPSGPNVPWEAGGSRGISSGAWSDASGPSPQWATGTRLHEALDEPLGLTWKDTPLRDGLYRLARARGVGVLLDRRVDPGREVTLSVAGVPLRDAFKRIAAAGRVRGCWVGPLLYLGPPTVVDRLPDLLDKARRQTRRLASPLARRLAERREMRWRRFATPRSVFADLVEEGRLSVEGAGQIPHDLWPAVELPPMPLCDRMVLVLCQFDLTFEAGADGQGIVVVPLPDGPAHGAPATTVPSPAERHPKTPTERAPGNDSVSSEAAPVDPAAIRIDRITIEQIPVGDALRRVAAQAGLDLKIDHRAIQRAGLSVKQRVRVRAENLSLDELLSQLVAGTGLAVRRDGRVVEVGPALTVDGSE